MRDIQFREWDQAREDMMPGHGMSYSIRKDSDDEVSFVFAHYESDESWEDNHRVLEQYTGVDDANNIPIYEGDIIRGLFTADEGLTLDGDRIPYFGQVEWCSQSNCLGWYVESQDGGMFELEQCHAKISLDNITGEVVGNIHENPELLEAD